MRIILGLRALSDGACQTCACQMLHALCFTKQVQNCESMQPYAQVSTGEVRRVGEPRLYTAFAPSPDGRFLLVSWLERPFSYTVPCGRFPKRIQLWDRCAPACRPIKPQQMLLPCRLRPLSIL